MEGRPWLRILLTVVGFGLLGWPVWRVTHADAVAAPVRPTDAAPAETMRVEIAFATPPKTFDLEYLGRPLLTGGGPRREFGVDWKAPLPKEGADLFLAAAWPPQTSATAVRVRVVRAGAVLADQTFWADESLAELVTVRKPQP